MSPALRQVWQPLTRITWLFFPFTSASTRDKDSPNTPKSITDHNNQPQRGAASSSSHHPPPPDRSPRSPLPLSLPPVELDTNATIALAFLLGSTTALGASAIYRRFFKRIKGAEWITPDLLGRKRWITGVVTSVGDADNFRLYHTPGFGWRGPLKFRHIPSTKSKRGLTKGTIHIRMAGMDAPEGSHFGRPTQPYSSEALAWLKENIEGRRIKCELLSRDQYKRVVALPLLPRTFRPWRYCRRWWKPQGSGATTPAITRNLPLEMTRAGWGFVYTQDGAVYGSGWDKEAYLAAQAEAQAARRGVWQHGTDIETPAEYKKRFRVAAPVEARAEEEEETEENVPEDVERHERVGFWRRVFGRRKRAGDSPS